MKKLSCIIVDDEPVARKILCEFVEQVSFLDLQGRFENAMKTAAFLSEHPVDLIFLDIEMPRMSGLQFLQDQHVDAMVILATAFPQYALEGYELDIIDYLLKPIAINRFFKAVYKARDFYELKHRSNTAPQPDYIFIKSDKRIEKIRLAEIIYVESVGNYVAIHTTEQKILAYLTLKSLEAQLPGTEFMKIHQSYMVNTSRINAIDGNEIRLDHLTLPISRNHRDQVMRIVQQRLLKR
jgi:DNA-binding LytR/AlgR family response regulator